MRYVVSLIALLVFISPNRSSAYEISPADGLHEAITAAAIDCIDQYKGRMPADCRRYVDLIGGIERSTVSFSVGELQKSTRWPDDPTRQIRAQTLVKFGFNAKFNCPRLARREGSEVWQIGLLCSSHYGKLQFFHAMASETGESQFKTRQKIIEWSDFLYGVANGQIDVSQDYCSFWDKNYPAISAAFRPANFGYCITDDRPNGWRVSTLFSMQCKKVFFSNECTEALGMSAARLSRSAARGALLHLIQDSYSQSHVARGKEPSAGGFEPLVECTYPREYYDYSQQDSGEHNKADKAPRLGESCVAGAQADDVVTATAVVIWMLKNDKGVGEFGGYFVNRVIGPSPASSLN